MSRSSFRHLLIVCLALLFTGQASAALRVEITQGVDNPVPIAIVPMSGAAGLPVDLQAVVEKDLEWTGQFKTLPTARMPEKPSQPSEAHFDIWRSVAADYLVVGQVTPQGGDYRLQFWVLDVYSAKGRNNQLELNVSARNLRQAGHTIANRVYEVVTGFKGVFTSRIAYVNAIQTPRGPRYELAVADYDGYNPRVITTSPESIMSPTWSPDGGKLAYVTFDLDAGKSLLRVQDIASGQVRTISDRAGINGAPSWSPDGRQLAMTLSGKRGNPDIFITDISSGTLRQLTRGGGIDTEPSWSPDGSSIVFTSDRGGRAHLYRISTGGGEEVRLTYDGKANSKAAWSPDGKNLAFVQQGAGGYRIAVMNLQTRQTTIVTDGPLDESPSFAPNGQALMYTRSMGGRAQLATTSLDGRVRTTLSQRGEVREPAWSPFNR